MDVYFLRLKILYYVILAATLFFTTANDSKFNSQTKILKMYYQGSRMVNFYRAFVGLTGVVYWPYRGPLYWSFVGRLHRAFEGEHVKIMLALYSLPSWGQHNKGANYVGPSGAQLKISTRGFLILALQSLIIYNTKK